MDKPAPMISMIMVVCLALAARMKDQVEHFKKIRVAVMAIGIDEEAIKNWKVHARDCVYILFVTSARLLQFLFLVSRTERYCGRIFGHQILNKR